MERDQRYTQLSDEQPYQSSNRPLLLNSVDLDDSKPNEENEVKTKLTPTSIVVSSFVIILVVTILIVFCLHDIKRLAPPGKPTCDDPCKITIVESIPENHTYVEGSPTHLSLFQGWKNLISISEDSIDIASHYFSLRGVDVAPGPSAWQGEQIFTDILEAGTTRGINIRMVESTPIGDRQAFKDTGDLSDAGAAEVRRLDMSGFMQSNTGILHSKMMLVDGKHFYIGSANLDWRSLTQKKDLGVIVYNCSCLAQDIGKIFEIYWYMSSPDAILPFEWSVQYDTRYNAVTPLELKLNNTNAKALLSSSPPELTPAGRSTGMDAVLDVIGSAKTFVSISVTSYLPALKNKNPQRYWSLIDDKLRTVAFNKNIHIRLLVDAENNASTEATKFLHSLVDLDGIRGRIEIKLYTVPSYTEEQRNIPRARLNHNKFMVTDRAVYIGNSDWEGDFFINDSGIGFVIYENGQLQQQLLDVFDRDWNSQYAASLNATH
ncbi:5'-3' exonuclease PLD3-like [Saccoglossus kowalevskii]